MEILCIDFECVSSPACVCVWRTDVVKSIRRLASGEEAVDEGRVCTRSQSLSYSMREEAKVAGESQGSIERRMEIRQRQPHKL